MKKRFHSYVVALVLGLGAGCDVEGEDPAGWADEADADEAWLSAAAACVRTVQVSTSSALANAVKQAKPGDCIVAANGSYSAPAIRVKATAEAPVVVRAANRGKATFTSKLSVRDASYVTVDGFDYTGGANVTIEDSDHCRITRSRFRLDGGTFVKVTGTSDRNRIDHSDFGPKTGKGSFVQPTGKSTRTRIDRNHFHDVSGGSNGRETVMLGCCGPEADYHKAKNVVEHNLFVNCDGENEMIGIKSSDNTVRYNTIRRSRGYISLRAGRANRIHSNYILGEGKEGTGGIRLFEDDHVIYNNYVETQDVPLAMGNGDAPGGSHAAIERATVVFNTFIARDQPLKIGGGGHQVPPSDSVFSNNLVYGSVRPILERDPGGVSYKGNIVFRTTSGETGVNRPADQFRKIDPKLSSSGGVLRPLASSPVIDKGVGSFDFVSDDVDRRAREGAPDVGAFEASSSAAPGKPLTAADVGPAAP